MNKTLTAIFLLMGTIIGAGVLGIPYVASKSGFPIAVFHMVLVAVIMIITMLYLGEIGLRTKKNHHLTGYASLYLGKKGKVLMFLAFIFGIYSAVLAYMTGIGESLSFLVFSNSSQTLLFGIGIWILLSVLCFFGLKALSKGEEIGVSVVIILLISIIVLTVWKVDVSNLTYINGSNFFLPYGVILFAFLGFSAIPEMERILANKKEKTKFVIITADLVVLALYLLFTLVVLGTKGLATPTLATIALGKAYVFLGIFTMLTSYLASSIALIDTLKFDIKLSHFKSWLITILVPLILFIPLTLFNLSSFTKILGIGGVISGGLTAILIIFIFKNAKKLGDRKPEYSLPYSKILSGVLIAIFILGAIMEIKNSI